MATKKSKNVENVEENAGGCCGDITPPADTADGPEEQPKDSSTDDIDWLQCLPWTGDEKAIPAGWASIAGVSVLDFVIPNSEVVTRSGAVIDVQIDNDLYKKLKAVYGPRVLVFFPATGGPGITREEWYKTRGKTDALKLSAIKALNMQRRGRGIRIGT